MADTESEIHGYTKINEDTYGTVYQPGQLGFIPLKIGRYTIEWDGICLFMDSANQGEVAIKLPSEDEKVPDERFNFCAGIIFLGTEIGSGMTFAYTLFKTTDQIGLAKSDHLISIDSVINAEGKFITVEMTSADMFVKIPGK